MQFDNVSIIGLSYLDAPRRVTSAEIEERLSDTLKRLGMRSNLLQDLSGILARRFWPEEVQPSEVATQAAELALEDAKISREKIGVIINTSVTKDFIEPAVASRVHRNLGLSPQCINFDVSNACLGFVNGIQIAGNMIDRDQVDYALIVNGENMAYGVERTIERLQDPNIDEQTFRDNFAALTLGSGAAAMVLARSELAPDGHKVVGGVTLASTDFNHLCVGKHDQMITDAHGLLVAGLDLAGKTLIEYLKFLNARLDDLDHMIIHQVSAPHTNKFIEVLNIDPEKIYRIFPEFGNIGPAGIPIVLAKVYEQGKLKRGDRVALMGIGSGLNCSMLAVDW